MIKDADAKSIYKLANKSFEYMKDPKKITIQRIFFNHWNDFLKDQEVLRRGLRPIVRKEVERMLRCGTINNGFEIYECPNCHKMHIICYTCKSRFCNSCGMRYAKARAISISKSTLDVDHRHVVFTIDERLRFYFLKNRELLNVLFDAVRDTITYVFGNMYGKNNKITPGYILTLHTFGRALNWNPHIHCLLTEGGMNDHGDYIKIRYINYESLRKSFMKQLLDRMKEFYKDDPKTLKELKQLTNTIYKEKTDGFYVNAPAMKQKDGTNAVVNYIIRYTGRPVMAQSRILEYDKSKCYVKYYYEDHRTDEYIEVEEHVFEFLKKLIIHIPEEQFKMIRYYGIYATCDHKKKEKVKKKLEAQKNGVSKLLSYRRELIDTFDTDPLLCSCGAYMEFIDFWVPSPFRKGGYLYEDSS